MLKNFNKNVDLYRILLLLAFALVCMSLFVFTQPFGDGPDEINRYKVVSFIENHGTIPVGDDPEIIIDGYGASYAFQPILTYILEGYLLFILKPLGLSAATKLIIARYVNVLIGLLAAVYTYKLSTLLFHNKRDAYLFTLGVVLLPQNLFIYTYVNTDGMGLLSCVMILYALFCGFKTTFDKKSIITLSVGIIICLLSYYNCYGYILIAFVCAIAFYLFNKEPEHKEMFQKAGIVALISFAGAGWWFIRNMLLYNGDIFALSARKACAAQTGNWYFLEQMSNTYQVQGYSLYEMVFKTDYYPLVWRSFIGMFGPMAIPTSHHLYMAYKYLTILCLTGFVIAIIQLIKGRELFPFQSKKSAVILTIGLVVAAIIPVALALQYSYTWDFQPQGRYYLPLLFILAFVLVRGLEAILEYVNVLLKKIITNERLETLSITFIYHLFYLFFFMSAAISVLMMLKYYQVF